MNTDEEILLLAQQLLALSPSQQGWIQAVINQFKLKYKFTPPERTDLVYGQVPDRIGDALRIHHAFSRQALSKDRFEFALERALQLSGRKAQLAVPRTNPGHDITIDGVQISIKTQADARIQPEVLQISKFMELGSGNWIFPELRDQMLKHMRNYERVLMFRCFIKPSNSYLYELLEIPKSLLLDAACAKFEESKNSGQNPRPGYGHVLNSENKRKYSLYFDGGSERKLQIRNLGKDLCIKHGTWEFESTPLA